MGQCPSCYSTAPVRVDRRRLCPAFTLVDRHATKGLRYPADPPTVDEIIAVMRAAGDDAHGKPAGAS
jgi:hypothetical protein